MHNVPAGEEKILETAVQHCLKSAVSLLLLRVQGQFWVGKKKQKLMTHKKSDSEDSLNMNVLRIPCIQG